MEVAGWQVARFVDRFMNGIRGKRVTVVAGSGNNGGDGLVAARFLRQRGAIVTASIVPSRDPTSLFMAAGEAIAALYQRGDLIELVKAEVTPS